MKAFVTGATGFVGGNLVRDLLDQDVEVVALSRSGQPSPYLQGHAVTWVQGDLQDPAGEWLQALVGCNWVFHVAALYSTDPDDASAMYEVNVGGTKAIMSAARGAGVDRVVHTSTVGTLGRRDNGQPADESIPFNLWETASHYAKSKALGEEAALEWAKRGLPVVVVNPCAPVGPGDHKPTSTGQRILDFLHRRLPSYVAGGINFVPVEDVCQGHILAAHHGQPGERYILGHQDGNLTRDGFLELMARSSGQPAPALPSPGWRARLRRLLHPTQSIRSFRPASLTADPRRAVEELGLPQSNLEQAFVDAVSWFRAQGMAQEHNRPQGKESIHG